ncbi:hypothetical protein M8J77_014246 [Diaphorina citri]|nr:hypothetical protein M8J77_014246 [Diaphorina citri]
MLSGDVKTSLSKINQITIKKTHLGKFSNNKMSTENQTDLKHGTCVTTSLSQAARTRDPLEPFDIIDVGFGLIRQLRDATCEISSARDGNTCQVLKTSRNKRELIAVRNIEFEDVKILKIARQSEVEQVLDFL